MTWTAYVISHDSLTVLNKTLTHSLILTLNSLGSHKGVPRNQRIRVQWRFHERSIDFVGISHESLMELSRYFHSVQSKTLAQTLNLPRKAHEYPMRIPWDPSSMQESLTEAFYGSLSCVSSSLWVACLKSAQKYLTGKSFLALEVP